MISGSGPLGSGSVGSGPEGQDQWFWSSGLEPVGRDQTAKKLHGPESVHPVAGSGPGWTKISGFGSVGQVQSVPGPEGPGESGPDSIDSRLQSCCSFLLLRG